MDGVNKALEITALFSVAMGIGLILYPWVTQPGPVANPGVTATFAVVGIAFLVGTLLIGIVGILRVGLIRK
ncbi:MAG: hypothetical protein AAB443_01120 [Patescibacteria group bacterium]